MKNPPVELIRTLLLAGLLAGASSATAQVTQYWDENGTDASGQIITAGGGTGNWNGAFWYPGTGTSDAAWTAGNIAYFGGTPGTVTVNAAESANGLTFAVSNYTINGSSTLTLGGTPTITLSSSGTNTMSCPIAGTVPVTIGGTGVLTLTHANTSLTGGVTINSGSTVQITAVTAAGTGTIADNGTLNLAAGGAANYAFSVTGGSSSVINLVMAYSAGSENLRFPGPGTLSGFGGTINVIGVNSTGGTNGGTFGAGQLILSVPASILTSPGTWDIYAGATIDISTPITTSSANVIINGPGNNQPYGALRLDACSQTGNVLLNGNGATIGDDNSSQPSSITGIISDGGNHYGFISVVANGKTLQLQGANTYTGATILGGNGEAGTLQADAVETPGTSGPFGSSPYSNPGSIVFSGGTLEYSSVNSNDYSGRFSTTASQAYNINVNGQTVNFATALASSGGALTLSDSAGGGTLTLSAANTYNGITTINSGTLDISGSIAGTVINANGGTLQLDKSTALPSGAILTLPASPASGMVNLNFTGTQNITTLNFGPSAMPSGTYGSPSNPSVLYQNAAFTGNGILNVEPPTYWDPGFSEAAPGSGGNGSWDSTSTNWFIGGTDTKWVLNNVANFSGNAGTVMLNATETADGLTFNTSGYVINGASILTLGGTPIITIPSGSAEIDCPIAGTGGLAESGPSTLTLGGANTFTGAVMIDVNGALILNGANAYAGATTIGSGGALTIGGSGYIGGGAYPGAIANGGMLTYNSSASQTLSGIISGTGTLTQSGPGPLISSGLNTFNGAITINSGTLTIGGGGDLGNNITFNTGSYGGTISDNGTFIYNSSAQQTLSGQINGTGGLTQNGPGVLTLSGVSSYTGPTTIGSSAQLIFSGVGALGSGDYETNITNNGTFTFNSSFPQTLGGTISGTGTLTQGGSATLTLNGTNTYTGATTISTGSLALGATGSVSDSASISIAAVATFDVSASPSPYNLSTSNSLSATGTASAAATIFGASGGVVNFGSQPLSLSFTPQTFTGDTAHPALNISQGALTLNGNAVKVKNSGGSALGVGTYTLIGVAGGTISGSATLNGSVTGAGLAAHLTASLVATGGSLNLVVAPPPPVINSFSLSGGNLVFSGTNGPDGGTYVVLMTTDVSQPLSSWTPIATNTFTGTGTFSVTNAMSGTQGFFTIQVTGP